MNIGKKTISAIIFWFSLLASAGIVQTQANHTDLQKRALQVLQNSCVSCHGEGNEKHGDIDFITDPEQLLSNGLVDPENPTQSQILIRMENEDDPMPPYDAPAEIHRPDANEIALIRKWIESLAMKNGGDLPQQPNEVPKSVEPQYPAIRQFLANQIPGTQSHWRFFTLENLYRLQQSKNARNVAFKRIDLSNHRAALAKAINSLSWSSDMATIVAVGQEQVILAVDLSTVRDVAGQPWSATNVWTQIESSYPYGLLPDDQDFRTIQTETKSTIPVMRVDWFIARALQPPLYDRLLGIPTADTTLHETLGLTFLDNIRDGLVTRSGFTQSGVSKNANRLIERHPSRYGYFWVSYDFLPGSPRGNLFQFPTGPVFEKNLFPGLAFHHDGGEIIFSLPNDLQGYMLIDNQGRRLAKGPAELVSDDKKVSGSPEIVNGVSCIACHRHGIYPFPKDQVSANAKVAGEIRNYVRRLHDVERIDQQKKLDRDRFLSALDKAIGPWLRDPDSDTPEVTRFPEPITPIVVHYNNSALGIAEVAAELGVTEDVLKGGLKFNNRLQELGLHPLSDDRGVIKRSFWEDAAQGQTPFQQAARQFDLGTPKTVLPPRKVD